MSVLYPSNNYNNLVPSSQLQADNIADLREKVYRDVVDASTGETILDHPTRTLYDYADGANTTDLAGNVVTHIMIPLMAAIAGMSKSQTNYITKEKQLKITLLAEMARKLAFDARKLKLDAAAMGNASALNLPNATKSAYPSSQTIRSFLGR